MNDSRTLSRRLAMAFTQWSLGPSGQRYWLDEQHGLLIGALPESLLLSTTDQKRLWLLHPAQVPEILIHGRRVKTPRWQQAFGADYHFSGQVSEALPVPGLLTPLVSWARDQIDPRMNGVLVNWYDAALGHYIGAHRDSTKGMCSGAPIIMVSFGADRVMRIRRWKGKERRDFPVSEGTVCVLPYETNLAWTHEILRRKKDTGRRISVTFRAFNEASSTS